MYDQRRWSLVLQRPAGHEHDHVRLSVSARVGRMREPGAGGQEHLHLRQRRALDGHQARPQVRGRRREPHRAADARALPGRAGRPVGQGVPPRVHGQLADLRRRPHLLPGRRVPLLHRKTVAHSFNIGVRSEPDTEDSVDDGDVDRGVGGHGRIRWRPEPVRCRRARHDPPGESDRTRFLRVQQARLGRRDEGRPLRHGGPARAGRQAHPALEVLQPGDTLWFKGGEYAFQTAPGKQFYYLGLPPPGPAGEPGKPISFRACPGETVALSVAEGGQPLLGNARRHRSTTSGTRASSSTAASTGSPARGPRSPTAR